VAKLKLGAVEDDKPVKVTVELSAALHRELLIYAEALAQGTGRPVFDPVKLIPPMIGRFMATDRDFAKARRTIKVRAPVAGTQNSY